MKPDDGQVRRRLLVTGTSRPARDLVGQAGLGLVMFHLGRAGVPFQVTAGNSPWGDIWAQLAHEKVGIEVKSTYGESRWMIQRRQIARVDYYAFVQIDLAFVYILTAVEVVKIVSRRSETASGLTTLHLGAFPADALNGWHRLGIRLRFDAPPKPEAEVQKRHSTGLTPGKEPRKLPYLHSFKPAHGRPVVYYRRGSYRVRLCSSDGLPIEAGVQGEDMLEAWERAHSRYEALQASNRRTSKREAGLAVRALAVSPTILGAEAGEDVG